MLIIKEKGKKKATWQAIYVVDFHHHMGKTASVKNLSPTAPDGTYSFQREIVFGNQWKAGLHKEMLDRPDQYNYEVPQAFADLTSPSPITGEILKAASRYKPDANWGMDNSFAVDQTVVFPMDDTYRDKEVEHYASKGQPTPLYSLSNSRLAQSVMHFPSSLRFIGFGRVFPNDPGALEEVERAVRELGLRGLKLHPKTEPFELDGGPFKQIIRLCGKLRIPLILHTSSITDARKIHDSVCEVVHEKVSSIKGLKALKQEIDSIRVVIGHCGWHASPELYQILTHPNIRGEISGIRSQGVANFFRSLKEGFDMSHFYNNTLPSIARSDDKKGDLSKVYKTNSKDLWSDKVMYGSDFPFMDHNQSIDVFASMFAAEFPGDLSDIRRILGLNALEIVPRSLPRKARDIKPANYTFQPTMNLPEFSNALMQNYEKGFTSVVISPHFSKEDRSDWTMMDILDNGGGVTNFLLCHDKPMPLIPKDSERMLKGLLINPPLLGCKQKAAPEILKMEGIKGLTDLNPSKVVPIDIL